MELVIDGVYRHIKSGGCYWLLAIASPAETPPLAPAPPSYSVMHSETEEVFEVYGLGKNAIFVGSPNSPKRVIYQAVTPQKPLKAPSGRWGRPYEMFCDGRFELLNPESGERSPLLTLKEDYGKKIALSESLRQALSQASTCATGEILVLIASAIEKLDAETLKHPNIAQFNLAREAVKQEMIEVINHFQTRHS